MWDLEPFVPRLNYEGYNRLSDDVSCEHPPIVEVHASSELLQPMIFYEWMVIDLREAGITDLEVFYT
jgi:hypothetical protein